ncbi:hypothetical protein BH24CHL6_BH24CHL6_10670 [soil metagenome]
MKFQATVEGTGKNTTGIPVPEEVVTGLAAGRRPAVTVTIGGHNYRTSVGSMDGRPIISLSAENRAKAGLAAGDRVEVTVELDTAPREVTVPPQLLVELAGDAAARETWDKLSYSNKRWHVESIGGAKTAETRRRRVAKSLEVLRAGSPR